MSPFPTTAAIWSPACTTIGRVDATEHTEGGTRIKAQVPAALAAGLRPFVTT